MLPYNYESPSPISYQIRALSSEYVPIVCGSATKNFLSELQKIAKLSGDLLKKSCKSNFPSALNLQLFCNQNLCTGLLMLVSKASQPNHHLLSLR